MAAILITNVSILDGTGAAPFHGEVLVDGGRIKRVAKGSGQIDASGADVVDGHGATLTPGLIESHLHIDFGSSVGRVNPTFFANTRVDSIFAGIYAAKVLLDYGYTSGFSAGNGGGAQAEVALRKEIDAGYLPGPRIKTCSPQWAPGETPHDPDAPPGFPTLTPREERTPDPDSARKHVEAMAKLGVDTIKVGLNGENGAIPGSSRMELMHEVEFEALMKAAKEAGVWVAVHAYTDEATQMAIRHGARVLYHCVYMNEATLDMLEARKDDIFMSPGPGVQWGTLHQGAALGITPEVAEAMEARATMEEGQRIMPKIHKRGVRVLPGGDYGFPMCPNGENARDLELFNTLYGFTPMEVMVAATKHGAELMGMGNELGQIKEGYIADLLLVDGDPLKNLKLFQDKNNLLMIMKDGKFHKRPPAEARRRSAA